MAEFDFSGWATRNDLLCSDGRIIRKDAFKDNDGKTVPLIWSHQHNSPSEVLGHALLENRDEGVYAYGKFNDTEGGKTAKLLVEHGDISALSIYANRLKQQKGNVIHGAIREVSLVLAGANPGAYIDSVSLEHGEDSDNGEAIIYTGEDIYVCHSADPEPKEPKETPKEKSKMADEQKKPESEETVEDVFNTLNEKQKTVIYALIGQTLEDADEKESDKGDDNMKHNLFENEELEGNTLSHDDMKAIIDDGKRYGSLKDSFIAHGIEDIDWLFPDAKDLNMPPEFIKRETGWVSKFMNSVHHTPFSRIKSMFADITEDDARAKGYIKGNFKKEQVFSLLKRTTTPTTVYKKQKLDRDDVIDITDFDVIAWLKAEMRGMLDEELARAFLVGDGRLASSDDKINETHIRPIWTDEDFFTIKATVSLAASATDDDRAKAFIKTAVKSKKSYKGSGNPTLYTTEDYVTDCLLLEDNLGHRLYKNEAELAAAMRVKDIVTVPVMENLTRTDDEGKKRTLMGIIVNPSDYNVGADKGGAVNMFDDFDIDYNQQKYLIETRCSGALIKPFSAIAIEAVTA